MSRRRILIAGIGNIFMGDDAFGVETAMALLQRPLPTEVTVKDFGIRGHDLAYALADGYAAAIFLDATPRGKNPGTVSLLELSMPPPETDAAPLGGHSLDPVAVLHLAANLGAQVDRLFLVGCEPAVLEPEDGDGELSPPVRAAVPQAVVMVEALVANLLKSEHKMQSGLLEAANW